MQEIALLVKLKPQVESYTHTIYQSTIRKRQK